MARPEIVSLLALTRIGSVNAGEVFGVPESEAEGLIARKLAIRSGPPRTPGRVQTRPLVTRDIDPGPGADFSIDAIESDEREEAEAYNAAFGLPPDTED